MRRSALTAIGAVGIATALTLTGCSGTSGGSTSSGPQTVPTGQAGDTTLTVWVMEGDYTPDTIDAINKAYNEATGGKVDVQKQTWDGITTKVSTALATNTPPDVLDLGNTQVAGYAENGGLVDLTSYADDLRQGQTWLGGLEEPATIDGSLYGVPGFGGARAVIYNKQMWADAGVTEEPTTFDQLEADLDKVKAANPASDFSAFYQPGEYWHAGMQFVWDAGGEIATSDDGTWTGTMSSPEAVEGLTAYKEFQNAYSTPSSQTASAKTPDINQIFADGKAGAILNSNGALDLIKAANPAMTDDALGTFPMPGISGENQPVVLGGSDWGIAAKSQNTDLALQWIKIATSPEVQQDYVFGVDGWIPNSTEGIEAAQPNLSEIDQAFFTAALNSKATPASGRWASIEADKSIDTLFSSVASDSKSVENAAKEFDSTLDSTLNK
ncbi:extracellular solute-binding protein [Frigoribacterium faeni]|uniref:extracellular solute-binding protein n=1 Tax=Frigoribacterium faeni TaxID=145483 RepID=UPI00241363B0|nr:extracellular solute-binding protein [Frigoribacterium faeni]